MVKINTAVISLAFAAATVLPAAVHAATATGSMNVRMVIAKACSVESAADLVFVQDGPIVQDVDATSAIKIVCSATTPYSIGLSAGSASGASTTDNTRAMTGPGGTIGYQLFQPGGYTTPWGDVIGAGANVVASTGTGSEQTFVVNGRVPAQTTPAPGTYTDVVAITVTY